MYNGLYSFHLWQSCSCHVCIDSRCSTLRLPHGTQRTRISSCRRIDTTNLPARHQRQGISTRKGQATRDEMGRVTFASNQDRDRMSISAQSLLPSILRHPNLPDKAVVRLNKSTRYFLFSLSFCTSIPFLLLHQIPYHFVILAITIL